MSSTNQKAMYRRVSVARATANTNSVRRPSAYHRENPVVDGEGFPPPIYSILHFSILRVESSPIRESRLLKP